MLPVERHEAKAQLARVAIGLLENGQTVVIDIGTTAIAVAQAIPRSFEGTVVTPLLPVAVELADRPGIEVLLAGGRVRTGDLVCSRRRLPPGAGFSHGRWEVPIMVVAVIWLVFALSLFRDASVRDPWLYLLVNRGKDGLKMPVMQSIDAELVTAASNRVQP